MIEFCLKNKKELLQTDKFKTQRQLLGKNRGWGFFRRSGHKTLALAAEYSCTVEANRGCSRPGLGKENIPKQKCCS